MGANQFEAAADRDVFFNWYFIFFYASSVLGATVIVYVQDTVSWTLGFGISCAASVVGLAALLVGARYYRQPAAQGSPFTGLARVIVAAVRKRKVNVVASQELKFYNGLGRSDADSKTDDCVLSPSDSFRYEKCLSGGARDDGGATAVSRERKGAHRSGVAGAVKVAAAL
jgi:peptide/histidine transporter 3/4